MLSTYSSNAKMTNMLQVHNQVSNAVKPWMAFFGELDVTVFKMLIMASKSIIKSPVLAGITSKGGIKKEHQLTYIKKWGHLSGLI